MPPARCTPPRLRRAAFPSPPPLPGEEQALLGPLKAAAPLRRLQGWQRAAFGLLCAERQLPSWVGYARRAERPDTGVPAVALSWAWTSLERVGSRPTGPARRFDAALVEQLLPDPVDGLDDQLAVLAMATVANAMDLLADPCVELALDTAATAFDAADVAVRLVWDGPVLSSRWDRAHHGLLRTELSSQLSDLGALRQQFEPSTAALMTLRRRAGDIGRRQRLQIQAAVERQDAGTSQDAALISRA